MHLADFPEADELTAGIPEELLETVADWDSLVPVRDQVLKALDAARENKLIGAPLEAAVQLSAGSELLPRLEKHAAELPGWFIVSQVELEPAASSDNNLTIRVERARGDKCERCWKFTTDVGSDPEFPTVCGSCAAVLRELAE